MEQHKRSLGLLRLDQTDQMQPEDLTDGQQPFAAGINVTYDQETGIVTLPATSPNTSQVWSNFASGQNSG